MLFHVQAANDLVFLRPDKAFLHSVLWVSFAESSSAPALVFADALKKATDLHWFQTLVSSEPTNARAPASRTRQSARSEQIRGREEVQRPAAGAGWLIQSTSLHLHSPRRYLTGTSPRLVSSQPCRGVHCCSKCSRVKYFAEQDVQCPDHTTAVNIQRYTQYLISGKSRITQLHENFTTQ